MGEVLVTYALMIVITIVLSIAAGNFLARGDWQSCLVPIAGSVFISFLLWLDLQDRGGL
jgi:hypothetical protein